jgi:transposase
VDEAFGVDSKRYYNWKKQLEETGSLEYRPPKERNGKMNLPAPRLPRAWVLGY